MSLIRILIFVSIFTVAISAQNQLHQALLKASQNYQSENYFEAIAEAKRVIYFDVEKLYHAAAFEIMGDAYKETGHYSEAVQAYTQAEINSFDLEYVHLLKIKKVKTNILRLAIPSSLRILEELENEKSDEKNIEEINYWRGWVYIFNDDWSAASKEFGKINNQHELKLFCEKVDNEKYSVTFAKTISAILPGSGQIYSGNYLNGIFSLGWNVLWGYLSVKSFIDNRIFDGAMISSLLWLRFYNGNLHNAEEFAKQKNIEINNKALYYLQNQYKGSKP
jgi:tetratricopeptide (TPR) repeat protein